MGIAPEQRGQIFERFYQAHGDGFRSGLGFGSSSEAAPSGGGTTGSAGTADGAGGQAAPTG